MYIDYLSAILFRYLFHIIGIYKFNFYNNKLQSFVLCNITKNFNLQKLR